MTRAKPSEAMHIPDAGPSPAAAGATCVSAATDCFDGRPARPVRPDPDRVRLCIVTRTEFAPAAMIRFVRGPDGNMVPDLARRLPGRGVWVTATRKAVETAVKRGLFAKSLKLPVNADKDLGAQVELLLAQVARQSLSLANKAGLVTTGFAKVEIALEKGTATALICASDASSDGAGKLERKFKAIRAARHLLAPVINDFTSDELGLAFGGSNVIHAAVASGTLAHRLIGSCQRLRNYRFYLNALDAAGMGSSHIGADAQGSVPGLAATDTAAADAATSAENSSADSSADSAIRGAGQAGA